MSIPKIYRCCILLVGAASAWSAAPDAASAGTTGMPSAHTPANVEPIFDDGLETFACTASDDPQPNVGAVEDAGSGNCPAGMVAVASFCIDRFEAALLDISVAAAPVPFSPYRNPGATSVRAVSVSSAVPQGYINGVQAAAACQAAGKRLCTDTEWLRACRGPSNLTYPYGNTRIPGLCNDARATHPLVEYFGTPGPWGAAELQHSCINQLPASLDRAGSNSGCQSAEGPYDMMGNLHEWTADPNGTYRGGYYVDTAINGPGCLYLNTAHDQHYFDYGTGFRCCADAPGIPR